MTIETTIQNLTQTAALLARDGVEYAINAAEKSISGDDEWLKRSEQADYIRKSREEKKKAIEQLKKLRAELNGRVFGAYKEEHPDYVT